MKRPRVLVVSGIPGTGKTTVAQRLAEQLGFLYVDAKGFIEEHNLKDGFDADRDSIIVSDDFLEALEAYILSSDEKGLVIDSHLAHELYPEYVDAVIITTCDRIVLAQRLKERRYSQKKIDENMEAEIFDTCFVEAVEMGHHRVMKVDTTKGCEKIIFEQIQEMF